MYILYCVVFLAVLVSQTYAGYRYNVRDVQNGEYQGPCEYDEDCSTRHAFCKSNRLCECKRQYQYDERSDSCFPTKLGLRCHVDSDCTMPNSQCAEEICQCRNGHVPPDGQPDSSCLPVRQLSAVCEDDAQCRVADQNSHCNVTARQCSCSPGFHMGWTRGQCVKDKGIKEACANHDECAAVQDQRSKVECRRDNDDNVNKCFCKSGYGADRTKNNLCIEGYAGDGASSVTAVIFTTVIAAVLATLR